jgi:hypothetical protein
LKKIFNFILGKSRTDLGILVSKCESTGSGIEACNLVFKLKPNYLKFKKDEIHQLADPFLLNFNGEIWMFFEEKKMGQKGCLKSICITDQKSVEGINLNLPHNIHLSYPYVFVENELLYMIPETGENDEIALFLCSEFPCNWKKEKIIMKGKYIDSSIHKENGVFYLFTTEKFFNGKEYDYLLKLFYTNSLDEDFVEHPGSPIHKGRKFGRSGGPILVMGEHKFRFSQDCSESYGRELIQFRITTLNTQEYKEVMICDNWIYKHYKHKYGGHHFSSVTDDSNIRYVAVDFNLPQSYFQRFINKFLF